MNRKLLKAFLVLTTAVALSTSLPVAASPDVSDPPHQSDAEPLYPTPLVLQGRRHPSYQVFAYNMQLPPIVVEGSRVTINQVIWVDSTRLHRVSSRQRETLGLEFAVSVGVIEHWRANLLRQEPLDGQALARDLCSTVIDYHYLKIRWQQYLPPSTSLQDFKAEALLALEAGELGQAWEMYYSLPRPPSW